MITITRYVLLVLALIFAKTSLLQAQEFKGIATYQSKMIMDTEMDSTAVKEMGAEMAKAIQNALQTAGEAEFTLQFTRTESLYEEVKQLEKPQPKMEGLSITISGDGSAYGTTYKDLEKGTYLREDEIQGKEFLISDDLEKWDWKITGEQKKIGNYTAIKATYLIPKPELTEEEKKEKKEKEQKEGVSILDSIPQEDTVVTAWFTPELPVQNGPGSYHGLPGLILEVSDGSTILLCTKVELNPEKFKLKKPKNGKKISLSDFEELREKKQKEMMERFKGRRSGDTQVIMIGG